MRRIEDIEIAEDSELKNAWQKIVDATCKKLAEPGVDDVNLWRTLCSDVLTGQTTNVSSDTDNRVEEDIQTLQRLAKVLISKTGYNKTADGLTWKERLAWCETRDHYICLFDVLGIPRDPAKRWSSGWLVANGFEDVVNGIKRHTSFKGWTAFRVFMGFEKPISERLCQHNALTMDELFDDLGVPRDYKKRMNSRWLSKNGFRAIVSAISRDDRFKESKRPWKEFQKYMKSAVNLTDMIRLRADPKQFEELFDTLGVPKDPKKRWSSGWLNRNGFSVIPSAFRKDTRFRGWATFLEFMGIKIIVISHELQSCSNLEQLNLLFDDVGIPEESSKRWNSEWLANNGFGSVTSAVSSDTRFGKWSIFIACKNGRLPWNGFTSEDQVFEYIDKEIQRLKNSSGSKVSDPESNMVTSQDYDVFLRMSNDNVVLREVERFFEDSQDQQDE